MTDLLVSLLLVSGVFFVLVSCFGILRMPDLFCRAHALTKSMTLGLFLIFMGVGIAFGWVADIWKIVAMLLFQLITMPISAHYLGLVAYRLNIARWPGSDADDLVPFV